MNMNIADFYLKNLFCNYDGLEIFDGNYKKIKYTDFTTLTKIFLEDDQVNELMKIFLEYNGLKYKEAVKIAMRLERFDVAMDIALKNKNYRLCKLIYDEESFLIQEAIEKTLNEIYKKNQINSYQAFQYSIQNMFKGFFQFINKDIETDEEENDI